jgi:predicted Zn-dependent peptidase
LYHIEKLDNGTTIILEPIDYVKSISIGLFVQAGSGCESPEQNGISHFIEHMNFKGTATRTAREIAEVLDGVGGKLNAYTSKEHTSYFATVLDEHFDLALDLLGDIFFNSQYRDVDIETEKKVVLEEIKMYEDTPDEIIHDLFVRNIWPNYYLGQPVIGSSKVVKTINHDDILEYLKRYYAPENVIVSISGRMDMDSIIHKVKALFGKAAPRKSASFISSEPKFRKGINLMEKETEQIHFCFGSRGISYHNQYRYPLLVLSSILGGSMSSILFQEIREKRGLVYSIFSYPLYFKNGGLFSIYTGTSKENAREVLEIIVDEIEKIKKNIPTKMIMTAKEQLKGNIILSLESTSNKMAWNGKNYFYYGKYMSVDEVFNAIQKITIDDIVYLLDYVFDPAFYSLTGIGKFESNIFEGVL